MSNSVSRSLISKRIFARDTKRNIFNLAHPARGSWFKVPRMTVINYHLTSSWSRCYYYPHLMTKGLGFSDKEVLRQGIEPWAIWLKTPHALHRRACLFKCQRGRMPRGQDERSQPLGRLGTLAIANQCISQLLSSWQFVSISLTIRELIYQGPWRLPEDHLKRTGPN